MVKRVLVGVLVLSSVVVASNASAQEVAAAERRFTAGMDVQMMTFGKIKGTANIGDDSTSGSTDADVGFALAPFLEYRLAPFLSLGVGPRFVTNIQGEDADSSAEEIDLLARVTALIPVSQTATLFGRVSPGFAILMFPDEGVEIDNGKGFVVDFAAGARFALRPNLFFLTTLGYHLSFPKLEQTVTALGQSVDVEAEYTIRYLHFGVGFGGAF